jgi:DoxX-like family
MKPTTATWPAFALRVGLSFIWLATGFGVLHPAYRQAGAASLLPLGLPPWVMVVTCLAEILLGVRVLFGRASTWLVALQFAVILTFSVILSVTEPQLLLDPWDRLTKNIPLLVILAVSWLVEREGWTRRACWSLRLGLALPWLMEGVVCKMVLGRATPLTTFLLTACHAEATPRNVAFVGAVQMVAALVSCCPHGWPVRLALRGQMVMLCAALLLGSFQEPLLWVHPFGPLSKNVPWLLGTLVVLWLSKEDRVHER